MLIMKKKYSFSILTSILFVFILISSGFAQSNQKISVVLPYDSIFVASRQLIETNEDNSVFFAQINQSIQKKDDLDELFLEDYDNIEEPQLIADPLYYFNYTMYALNDILYFAAIKPLASAYKAITPNLVRKGMKNFFHNLVFPVRFVNNVLQGKIKKAGTEFDIFLVNSTFGVLGFGQVAQNKFNLRTSDEDLGQSLGYYSIGNGCYLMLPVLGPSTIRDALGRVGDSFLTPIDYLEPWELSWGLKAYDRINDTSFHIGDYEALKKAALDPYAAIRDAYIQHRQEKIKN